MSLPSYTVFLSYAPSLFLYIFTLSLIFFSFVLFIAVLQSIYTFTSFINSLTSLMYVNFEINYWSFNWQTCSYFFDQLSKINQLERKNRNTKIKMKQIFYGGKHDAFSFCQLESKNKDTRAFNILFGGRMRRKRLGQEWIEKSKNAYLLRLFFPSWWHLFSPVCLNFTQK